MNKLDPKQFIQAQNYGVLSTHSKSEEGFPFGSITPYIISKEGDIAIFISHLAEHTHNINANAKVSLTIFDPADADDPSAGARVTCLAIAKLAQDENQLRKQYLEQFPTASMTLELPGFNFYLLKLTKIRLVAGFGQIKWLDPSSLSL
ncbi:MAG: pyridoxamine 5'-phosphate oxidase family protein [Methylophaga sp.]|nr:pyridoxamine 5'-phosphate oxidase family protein [Methylophaga sp.]